MNPELFVIPIIAVFFFIWLYGELTNQYAHYFDHQLEQLEYWIKSSSLTMNNFEFILDLFKEIGKNPQSHTPENSRRVWNLREKFNLKFKNFRVND